MTLYEYDEELHKQTIRKESYEDGFDDGQQNGKLLQLTELICRKLQKNKSPETIAEELEEDLDTIQHIYAIAKDFAPDYDVAKIVEQYKQVSLPV